MSVPRQASSDPAFPPLLSVCGLDSEGRIAARWPSDVILSGARPEQLTRQLAEIDLRRYRLIVSFGLAGGLDPALKAGDVVVGEGIVTPSSRFATPAGLARTLAAAIPGAIIGTIAGVDRALADPAAKRTCRQNTGAIAADMESHVVAQACAAAGVPFIILRAISDGAEQSLPELANVALDVDGKLRPGAIAKSLLARPGQLMVLPRLALDTARAFARLKKAGLLAGLVLTDWR